jgi:cell division septal protein FtsQ
MGDMRETQEIRLIRTGDRKPVSRRERKKTINWRSLYKKSVRREFRWALLAYGLTCLVVIEAVIIYVLQAGPI